MIVCALIILENASFRYLLANKYLVELRYLRLKEDLERGSVDDGPRALFGSEHKSDSHTPLRDHEMSSPDLGETWRSSGSDHSSGSKPTQGSHTSYRIQFVWLGVFFIDVVDVTAVLGLIAPFLSANVSSKAYFIIFSIISRVLEILTVLYLSRLDLL